jgi:hypothetical protein
MVAPGRRIFLGWDPGLDWKKRELSRVLEFLHNSAPTESFVVRKGPSPTSRKIGPRSILENFNSLLAPSILRLDLTSRNPCPINRCVRSVLCSLPVLVALLGGSHRGHGQTVPQSVLDQAEAATKILGQQVLEGNFSFSFQRMYSRCKKRAAIRLASKDPSLRGKSEEEKERVGEAKLVKKLTGIPAQMQKNGITMLKFEVLKPSGGHEVFLGRGLNEKTGKPIQMYLEWLVFVPTRAEYRVIDPATRVPKRIERWGYQVAIVKKGTSDWYFIDGSNLTKTELRSFFPRLPTNQELLGLPKVGGAELKN